jgi:[protein-PII] uridylyltransferase
MTPSKVPGAFLQEFLASMPRAYRTAFPPEEASQHAQMVLARKRRRASASRVESAWHPGTIALCVVADDRPGLLATTSAAFVLAGLDVVHAEAYTRRTASGINEAVDLFWVREFGSTRSAEIDGARVSELETTLGMLLDGRIALRDILRQRGQTPPSAAHDTRVRFLDGRGGGLAVLEVETADRAGLLLALAEALYAQRVNIARAEVRTENGKVLDHFMVTEVDGSPIGATRRLAVQVAVLGAIQPSPAKPENKARPAKTPAARAAG